MNISLILIGKTDENYIETGLSEYLKRLKKYVNFEIFIIPRNKNSKNLSENEQKKYESKKIMEKISKSDYLVLLDEKGKSRSSTEFADFLNNRMSSGIKNLVFLIGGPYGVDNSVYERANYKLSLSKMTFSHQIIRLFFLEQIYRAFTILNNEPYHH